MQVANILDETNDGKSIKSASEDKKNELDIPVLENC